MKPIGIFFLLISAVILAVEVWLLYVSLHYRSKHCETCKGYLKQQKYTKNAKVGLHATRNISNLLEFEYTYRVDGQSYHINGSTGGKHGDLPISVDVVYQRKRPQRAYIKTYYLTFPMYPVVCVILLPFFLLFLIGGFMV